ncbi:uncharacterized protein LOC104883848 [Beta vulgaris subsp. vulgaris]|uniref:uncharacterized protein LOC104883848 n=1 Tax=Beta vulgaris subsp. vulgaris TaxID=3555 RepID=UPI00053F7248|nr:uncharacterized protein LOC104883848 [Beta vulgaris subsp. vulgaris]
MQEFLSMPQYSRQTIMQKLGEEKPPVHWDRYVWNRLSINKCKFINWLVMRGRLHTADKSRMYDPNATSVCFLCGLYDETQEHLLFKCCYSQQVLTDIKRWMGMEYSGDEIQGVIRSISRSRRSKFQKNACNAALAGAVYSIWMARNDSKWNLKVPRIQCLVKMLKDNVRRRIFLVMPKKVSRSDRSWFNTL